MGNTVISAVYGTVNAGVDVTEKCQRLVNTGNDDITASNKEFGLNFDPGVTKSFAILYQNPALNGGNPIALGCQEGATIDLVPTPPTATTPVPKAGNPKFTILRAMYGTAHNGFDVTLICQWLVNNGGTTIPVNNTMFGDPQPGVQKSFAIVYAAAGNGPQQFRGCAENAVLDLAK